MPEIYYEAIAANGEAARGLLDAESPDEAAAQLAACELTPRRLADVPLASGEATGAPAPPIEVRETLRMLQQATLNPKLRGQIKSALGSDPRAFESPKPNTFLGAALIHCAKLGDPLTALGPLIEFERDLKRLKSESRGRFIYAYGLLLFASCVFSVLDYFLGETFRTMFREFELKLPTMTIVMMKVGPAFWTLSLLLALVPLSIFVARALFKNQLWFDRALDGVILWGPWRRWRYSAQAFAYLGAALKADIPLPLAAEAAAGALPRPYSAWQLHEIGERTLAGAPLPSACASANVQPMVMPFLLSAERSGQLADGCTTAARLLLERCRRRRMMFVYFLESFAVVFVLVTALCLLTSYLLPLMSLITNLAK